MSNTIGQAPEADSLQRQLLQLSNGLRANSFSQPTLIPGAANAAANTSALQAALANRGLVIVSAQGDIYFSGRSIIYSDTTLVLNPKFKPTMASGTNDSWLINDAVNQLVKLGVAKQPSSVTAAGNVITVNYTNHGRAVGDFIYLNLAGASGYAGVFRIDTVPNANSFTYLSHIEPITTPAPGVSIGSPLPYQVMSWGVADRNISIYGYGSQLQLNNLGNTGGPGNYGYWLGLIDKLVVRQIRGAGNQDPLVSTAQLAKFFNLGEAVIEDVDVDYTATGVMCTGPWRRLEIRRVTGNNMTDDCIELAGDQAPAFVAGTLSEGDMYETVVEGVNNNGTKQVGIYSQKAIYRNNIELKDVYGFSTGGSAFGITAWADTTGTVPVGLLDTLKVRNLKWAGSDGRAGLSFQRITITDLDVDFEVKTAVAGNTANRYFVAQYCAFTHSKIRAVLNPTANFTLAYAPIIWDDGAFTTDVIFDRVNLNGNTELWNQNAGTLPKVTMNDCVYNGSSSIAIIRQTAGAIINQLVLNNLYVNSANGGFSFSNIQKIQCNGVECNNSNELFQVTANACEFSGSGVNMIAGGTLIAGYNAAVVTSKLTGVANETAHWARSGGTATFNPKSFDIRQSTLTTGIVIAIGNFMTHTGVTNPGPAISNATGYYSQAMGAAVPGLCA